jgi:hypothetical protein
MSWPLRESLCRSPTPAAFDASTVGGSHLSQWLKSHINPNSGPIVHPRPTAKAKDRRRSLVGFG